MTSKENDEVEKNKEKGKGQPEKTVAFNKELVTKERIEKLKNELESLKSKLK